MDELEISGKRYISTRRAAREHGYHSDYMGQLIRGKKVTGQKVGRAWYIEEGSLNAYLGKAAAEAPAAAPAPAAVEAPVAAPVERLVVEEVVPAPEPVAQAAVEVAAVPHPAQAVVEQDAQEEYVAPQPVAVHVAPQMQSRIEYVPQHAAREIHHSPYIEEERRVPLHTPMPAPAPLPPQSGGLRYAADDFPVIPVVTRAPQQYAPAPVPAAYASAHHASARKFPVVSLSVVGAIAILASVFASNFVTASLVSEEGRAATVQYSIHW